MKRLLSLQIRQELFCCISKISSWFVLCERSKWTKQIWGRINSVLFL